MTSYVIADRMNLFATTFNYCGIASHLVTMLSNFNTIHVTPHLLLIIYTNLQF